MLIHHCLYCDAVISPFDYLCYDCMERLNNAAFDSFVKRCKVCGYPVASSIYSCKNCNEHKDLKVYPILDYSDSFARRFLELYKFDKHKKFSKIFALIVNNHVNSGEFIVPIPSSNTSLKKRGWDQMLEIAKKVKTGYVTLLKNNYSSDKQSKELNYEERKIFSKNKFTINECPHISGIGKSVFTKESGIVLLDDVYTTGLTLNAAKNVLLNNGYENIRAVTLYSEP